MYKHQGKLYFAPSDLTLFMESPFASWMERLAIEHPDQIPQKDPADPLMVTLTQKGFDLEDALQEKFIQQGLSVVKIDGQSQEQKREQTLQAMKAGKDVIVQARLDWDHFGGYSDFLVKIQPTKNTGFRSHFGEYYYEVWDTKLASQTKPAFIVQLCCYAQMLEAIQGHRPEYLTLALGDGTLERFKTIDCLFYYYRLKEIFDHAHSTWHKDQQPDPADSSNWGNWSQYAETILLEKDHLFQVANITKGQIKKINKAGIQTMSQLANTQVGHISGINNDVLLRLKSQAAIQIQTKRQQQQSTENQSVDLRPCFEIIRPPTGEKVGLALLPPHSPLDVFFDIEGYPLDQGGLEYLWGASFFNADGERDFIDFWAHNKDQEKKAFQAFIDWAFKRWQQEPSMHIYHYANYEIAACRKLMGRYGVCEYEVDQLLRNEVFVDLFKIVKTGVLLGEPRYSIKNVERLYRGKRATEVGNGGDSVVVYEQWRAQHLAGIQGDTWQSSTILKAIRDYNIDDCNSTQELVSWLREQQSKYNIDYLGKTEVIEPEEKQSITELTKLRDRLLERAEKERLSNEPSGQTNPNATLMENLAWVLEFHRREAKPVFWRLFERLGLSHTELLDDLDCLALCKRTQKEAFKPSSRSRNLAYEYRFDPAQEFKGAASQFYLLGVETQEGKPAKGSLVANESDLENGLIVIQSKEAPPQTLSLVPDEYVNPNPIPSAIEHVVRAYEQGSYQSTPVAIIDFLNRAEPRFKKGFALPSDQKHIAPSNNPTERLNQIIQAVCHLDRSYLTIQGPPGAGKSYTGKHIIAELIRSGARVGIASNSHKAINHLLLSTAKLINQMPPHEQPRHYRFICTSNTDPELEEQGILIAKNNVLADKIEPGCVIGTTAWGFAREDMIGQLDYLFIDEAGQVAVANLIGMSRSSDNLILMGDQMQLGQPSQGTHPTDSGLSILDYLLHETPTIPENMGVFLGTTYRMHTKINQFISHHIYDGKLAAHPSNDLRVIEVPCDYQQTDPNGPLGIEAGIVFVPVEHEGNSQASDEEVQAIAKLCRQLLGRTFHTGQSHQPTRPIDWEDMLFVAPYNHQVGKLRQALGDQAKVGSVDKFQGQEAPIVFMSMCASDPSDTPRGIDFLFDKHRLNVAISRAQSLAIIVGNPNIGQIRPARAEQIKLINLFNALALEYSHAN